VEQPPQDRRRYSAKGNDDPMIVSVAISEVEHVLLPPYSLFVLCPARRGITPRDRSQTLFDIEYVTSVTECNKLFHNYDKRYFPRVWALHFN
jgi:hypothetical protein